MNSTEMLFQNSFSNKKTAKDNNSTLLLETLEMMYMIVHLLRDHYLNTMMVSSIVAFHSLQRDIQ